VLKEAEAGAKAAAAERAGLAGRGLEAAELEELAMMAEAAKVACSVKIVRGLIGPMPGILRSSW
jgi:hypothetical protein